MLACVVDVRKESKGRLENVLYVEFRLSVSKKYITLVLNNELWEHHLMTWPVVITLTESVIQMYIDTPQKTEQCTIVDVRYDRPYT